MIYVISGTDINVAMPLVDTHKIIPTKIKLPVIFELKVIFMVGMSSVLVPKIPIRRFQNLRTYIENAWPNIGEQTIYKIT